MFTIRAYNHATKAYVTYEVEDVREAKRLAYGLGHATKQLGFGRRLVMAKPTVEVQVARGKVELARYIAGTRVCNLEHLAELRAAMPVEQAKTAPKRVRKGKKTVAKRKPGPVAEPAEPMRPEHIDACQCCGDDRTPLTKIDALWICRTCIEAEAALHADA